MDPREILRTLPTDIYRDRGRGARGGPPWRRRGEAPWASPPFPPPHPLPSASNNNQKTKILNSREPDHEGPVANVANLVHHEGHSPHLPPAASPQAGLMGCHPGLPPPGVPDLARVLHPLAEVGVDLLVFRHGVFYGGGVGLGTAVWCVPPCPGWGGEEALPHTRRKNAAYHTPHARD